MLKALAAVLPSVLPVVLPTVLSLLVAGLTWASVHLAAFLNAKAKSSRAFAALNALDALVFAVVQDVVAAARVDLLATGGQLTPATWAKVKQDAIAKVKADLGAQGLATLQKVLAALLGGTSIESLISGKVQAAAPYIPAPIEVGGISSAANLSAVPSPK